ncbi:transglycosylase domain-containing protein [Herbiconiux sp. L3-i23]|uniref:transglycosylase domain-containing protein n=1 Tax=Herbiconiux sp. L3-i23 TaxID=2905871 RepID=UPI002057BC11|nr:transglycosylase domain-containing protein [Herbiconiux sp. L3-i23]BDI22967.1 carboxypeptidase [Herbiconiux sp. L3-i23]
MPVSSLGGRVGGLLGFIGLSVAAGVLATAAVTPAIALSGAAANSTIGVFEDLPDYLEIQPLSQRTNVYATNADGSAHLLAYFYNQNRVEVGPEQVNGFVKDAAIAGENPRYYDHGGVDLQGTVRAIVNTYILGGSVQGGSSITQQYVKNVNIQNAIRNLTDQDEITAAYEKATATTESRKVQEMKYAIGLEKRYTKDEILMGYLNIAGFGGTVYGVEAAANYYFGTTAANATLPQAASLLAIVNNPERFRLDQADDPENGAENGYAANKTRRDYILGSMLTEGMITQQEHDDAVAAPVEPNIVQPTVGCSAAGQAGFFCDYVRRAITTDGFFGDTADERLQSLITSGYDIYTTLDMDLQAAAESAINDNVPMTLADFDIGASVVTVEPGTGKIRAMAQNKIYSDDPGVLASDPSYSAVNFNADYEMGGSTGFQPGSTYKIFTLLEWLKEGHGLNETVDGRVRDWQGSTWQDSCVDGGSITVGESYRPRNDENDSPGSISALQSTVTSKNTGFLAMANELDLCGIRDTAASMGVHRADQGAIVDAATGAVGTGELLKNPADVLGTNEVAPLQMAGAFATIAAGGLYCPPTAIERIVAPDGSDVPLPANQCQQVLDPAVAATAAYALENAFEDGTGATSSGRLDPSAPTFGKTGTTDEAYATWMSGATTKAATVSGVYNVTGFVNQREYRLGGEQAAVKRHRIFPAVMSVANAKWGGDPLPEPSQQLLRGSQVSVPDVTGLTLDAATDVLERAGFTVRDGGARDSDQLAGTVVAAEASGGRGGTVTLYTSNGSQAQNGVPTPFGGNGGPGGGGNGDGDDEDDD